VPRQPTAQYPAVYHSLYMADANSGAAGRYICGNLEIEWAWGCIGGRGAWWLQLVLGGAVIAYWSVPHRDRRQGLF
jgi:hypothetical protein